MGRSTLRSLLQRNRHLLAAKIAEAAKGNLKKVSLELGGKSPMILFADADLNVAIPAIASGIFYNMGQTCTVGSRLYVEESLSDHTRSLRIGPGLDPALPFGGFRQSGWGGKWVGAR
ncbi:aldehyde dehydrogenase family protein [Aurantiacibacter flavus]|uniref:Aldehyde dehydrogenase family protein n=1 Tax=Aurantiacibacter flavus TaxID=3145232 RepID=A0ABV0CV59_9SPHN